MVSVCFYFQVHQPYRIKKYRVFEITKDHNYFDIGSGSRTDNEKILRKVAEKCYIPANRLMLELLENNPKFKISYSISGIALEQMEKYAPEAIELFQKMVNTGRCEILAETYYHSLSALYSEEEFKNQIRLHEAKITKLFGVKPSVFRNTELIYNNHIANIVEKMGYKGIIAEGVERHLGWRSPNFVYSPVTTEKIKLLLKNYKLSDDIAFRFSEKSWSEWPLKSEKFSQWINAVNGAGNVVNLFMDYETFGEHQWADTGIFDFLRALPGEILKHPDNDFKTPSEVIESYPSMDKLDIHEAISWADVERDLSAWLGNKMQQSAIKKVYEMENEIKNSGNVEIIEDWRKLQTSDHFYYMCTKWFADGDVHKYFNPYETPYDAFIAYMNVLSDMEYRVERVKST